MARSKLQAMLRRTVKNVVRRRGKPNTFDDVMFRWNRSFYNAHASLVSVMSAMKQKNPA